MTIVHGGGGGAIVGIGIGGFMLTPWDIVERPVEIIGISSVISKAVSVSNLCIKVGRWGERREVNAFLKISPADD